MQLHFHKTELHLKETFSIAYGNYDKRDALVVKLSHLGKDDLRRVRCHQLLWHQSGRFCSEIKEIQPRIENQKSFIQKIFCFLEQFQLHHFYFRH